MLNTEDIKVRFAEERDWELLRDWVDTGELEVDWSRSTYGWVVAEGPEGPVGVVQLLLGVPFGRMEHLSLAEGLSPRDSHAVMMTLVAWGMTALKQTGAQYVVALVEFGRKGWKRVLKKHYGARVTQSGHYMVAKLEF